MREFTISPETKELVEDLVKQQKSLGLGNEEFARRHLSYSSTVWSRVISGEYWGMVDDPDRVISTLQSNLRDIETARIQEARYGNQDFVPHRDAKDVLEAVKQCKAKPLSNANRLICYLAPTGGGKSQLCGRLIATEKAWVVEARVSWLRSYWCCLRDIARACGVNPEGYHSAEALENELIRRLNSRRQVLAIDEGEFFCAATLNLIKLLLNKSSVVIVLCVIPEKFDKWFTNNWHEAQQLRRRTHDLIRLAPCDQATARLFMKGVVNDEAELNCVAAFARDFGSFTTLTEMRAELSSEVKPDRLAVIKAGNRVRSHWGLPALFAEK